MYILFNSGSARGDWQCGGFFVLLRMRKEKFPRRLNTSLVAHKKPLRDKADMLDDKCYALG